MLKIFCCELLIQEFIFLHYLFANFSLRFMKILICLEKAKVDDFHEKIINFFCDFRSKNFSYLKQIILKLFELLARNFVSPDNFIDFASLIERFPLVCLVPLNSGNFSNVFFFVSFLHLNELFTYLLIENKSLSHSGIFLKIKELFLNFNLDILFF